jgi:predicted ATPase
MAASILGSDRGSVASDIPGSPRRPGSTTGALGGACSAAPGSEAVALFVQRASAVRGEFALGPGNVAAVGEICRRLDGIPLAIELAAARAGALRPVQIAGLLDERFRLLTRGRAGAADRQQTLEATVEWSYALLSATEQRLFDCLGVFPASFDADAAVKVAAAAGLDRWDVLDGLTALVGQSLLAEEEGPDQASRYRLLETMRAYARQHLSAAQLTRLHRAHARYYAAFAERAGPEHSARRSWTGRVGSGPNGTTCKAPSPGRWPAVARRHGSRSGSWRPFSLLPRCRP